jgi:type IV secretion system protein VirB10
VNQNIPPGQSGRPFDDRENSEERQFSHEDIGEDRGEANPYYADQQAGSAPDLDANAPLLRSNDLQRLNRKALIFLAAIVALLMVAAVWTFKIASSDSDGVAKPEQEKVVIPELPLSAAVDASTVNPIEVSTPPVVGSDLPPLPAQDYSQAQSSLPPDNVASNPGEATLMERRMTEATADGQSAEPDPYLDALLATQRGQQPNGNAAASSADEASSAQFINNPDALLVRGTYLRCVLETRIITDIPGFTSCIVTEPIYSINGRRLLLPKGAKIFGRYDTDANGPRVAVIWDRITTPNGIDVNMASPGIDNLGGAGHPGDYNAHWGSRIASALMISLISDAFKYAGAKNGPPSTTVTNGIVTQEPFDSNTARTMERLANQAFDRSINRPATVTINQGTVVNVYVAKDVDFSAVLAGS